ncbi:MAG: type II toxin-antitoxin system VapC family toxin [Thermoplasmatota archaeon]
MTRRAPPKRGRLFVDTGPLLAAVLQHDPDHVAAKAIFLRLGDGEWAGAYTSDYVLAEAWNFLRRKVKRKEPCESLYKLAFGSADARPAFASILRIHGGLFARALTRYREEFDRGLSLTDWTTVVAMEESAIDMLATFDRGFEGLVPTTGE